MAFSKTLAVTTALSVISPLVSAFDAQSKSNVAVYYGQGAGQPRLREFCQDSALDIINIGFINQFPDQQLSGWPGSNFGNQCSSDYYEIGGITTTLLSDCHQIQEDIPICQAAGKKIFLSLGGANPANQQILSTESAVAFANFLWASFGPEDESWAELGGPRPFGSVVVDGFDFDIEHNGGFGYADMVNRLRELFTEAPDRTFYISGAPQCAIPDAQLSDAIANSPFDFVWVQFYNTPGCSAKGYIDGTGFNLDDWVEIIKHSANPDAKLLVGVPASENAAQAGYYLTPEEVQRLVKEYMAKYPDTFGGIMLWEATASAENQIEGGSYADSMKKILTDCDPSPPVSTTTTPIASSTPVTSHTSTPSTPVVPTTTSTSTTSTPVPPTTTSTSTHSTPVIPTTTRTPTHSTPVIPTTTRTPTHSTPVIPTTTRTSTRSTPVIPTHTSHSSHPTTPTGTSTSSHTPGSSIPGSSVPVPSTSTGASTSSSTSSQTAGLTTGSSTTPGSSGTTTSGITSASLTTSSATATGTNPEPTTITTVIVTSYTSICPTGFTTITTTYTTTYCPGTVSATATATATTTQPPTGPGPQTTAPAPPPEGWTTTVTVCTHCAATPTTVTLTVPCTTTAAVLPTTEPVVPTNTQTLPEGWTTTVTVCTECGPTPTTVTVTVPITKVETVQTRPTGEVPVLPPVHTTTSRPLIYGTGGVRPRPSSTLHIQPSTSGYNAPVAPTSTPSGVSPIFTGAAPRVMTALPGVLVLMASIAYAFLI